MQYSSQPGESHLTQRPFETNQYEFTDTRCFSLVPWPNTYDMRARAYSHTGKDIVNARICDDKQMTIESKL